MGRSGNLRSGLGLRAAMALLLAAAVAGGALPRATRAQEAGDDQRREYNLKLAFLVNFGRYVTWPAESFPQDDAPLVIGVLGLDPFDGGLDRVIANRKIQGRAVAVRHFAAMADYQPCHMLFVPRAVPAADQAEAVRKAGTGNVLVVGEAEGFAAGGGGINLYRDRDAVRFELNVDAFRQHHLQADAKLLSLARIVKGN